MTDDTDKVDGESKKPRYMDSVDENKKPRHQDSTDKINAETKYPKLKDIKLDKVVAKDYQDKDLSKLAKNVKLTSQLEGIVDRELGRTTTDKDRMQHVKDDAMAIIKDMPRARLDKGLGSVVKDMMQGMTTPPSKGKDGGKGR